MKTDISVNYYVEQEANDELNECKHKQSNGKEANN